jgi:hypothetical protein
MISKLRPKKLYNIGPRTAFNSTWEHLTLIAEEHTGPLWPLGISCQTRYLRSYENKSLQVTVQVNQAT